MEPTPTEAAAIEQQQREAAFTRARVALAAIRSGEAGQWRNTPGAAKNLIYLRGFYIVMAVMLFLCAFALVNQHGWAVMAWDDPLDVGGLVLVLLIGMWSLYAAFQSVVERRRMHPAKRLLLDFYEEAGQASRPLNLERFVVEADAERSDRRTPEIKTGASVLCAPGIADNLGHYWHNLLKPAGKRRHGIIVKSAKIQELAPDLVLATASVVVTRPLSAGFYVLLGISIVAWELLDPARYGILVSGATGAGLALLLLLAARWFMARGGKDRTHSLRKLLVCSNNQWRMFCGDWEGWEERDLSWLDDA